VSGGHVDNLHIIDGFTHWQRDIQWQLDLRNNGPGAGTTSLCPGGGSTGSGTFSAACSDGFGYTYVGNWLNNSTTSLDLSAVATFTFYSNGKLHLRLAG